MSADKPTLVSIEPIAQGWMNKYILKYALPNGNVIEYESVSRRKYDDYAEFMNEDPEERSRNFDGISIVPFLPDGSILLIREFRYPVNSWCIAFPAGLVEKGESVPECISRELREETGYKVRDDVDDPIKLLPQPGFSSVGMTDESVQLAFVQVEPYGSAELEPNEVIEPFTLKPDQIEGFLKENTDIMGVRAQLVLTAIACGLRFP